MSDKGWIKIHRKLYDNPYASDPHWVALWCYFLCKASRGGKEVLWKGKRYKLQPGQFTAGYNQMAKETGINREKIRRVVALFKSDTQITHQTSSACSLFTVLNWDEYQTVTPNVTLKRHSNDTLVTPKQEVENIRSIYIGLLDEFPKLNTEAFKDAWERKMTHRKERKDKALTKSTIKAKFKEFSEWGHDDAVQAINESIANNWQGIFKPKGTNAKTGRNRDTGTLNDGTIDRANDELF